MNLPHLLWTLVVVCVLSVCEGLRCTIDTQRTCTPSRYVTGRCIEDVCECVEGTLPTDNGCEEPYIPELWVSNPLTWSGEIYTNGYIALTCGTNDFDQYRWFANGGKLESTEKAYFVKNTNAIQNLQCTVLRNGRWSNMSDAITVHPVTDKPKIKPLVAGMPQSAPINSTLQLRCERILAIRSKSIEWKMDNQTIGTTRHIDFKITAENFNKSITCALKKDNFEIESDPIMTPEAPADDIPGVVLEMGNPEDQFTTMYLSLTCNFNTSFAKTERDSIMYTFGFPDGSSSIPGYSNSYRVYQLTGKDTGAYNCTASFRGKPTKTSPDLVITKDTISVIPVMEVYPKYPLFGGYMAAICTVPGHNVTSMEFEWFTLEGVHVKRIEHHSDSAFQVNNITSLKPLGCAVKGAFYKDRPVVISVTQVSDMTPTLVQVNNTTPSPEYDFNLSCESKSTTPGLVYEWSHLKQVVFDYNKTMGFFKAKGEIAAVTCALHFKLGRSNDSNEFIIPAVPLGGIKPTVNKLNRTVPAPFDFVLICDSDFSHPDVLFNWYIDNVFQTRSNNPNFAVKKKDEILWVQCQIALNGQSSDRSNAFMVPSVSGSTRPGFQGSLAILALSLVILQKLAFL